MHNNDKSFIATTVIVVIAILIYWEALFVYRNQSLLLYGEGCFVDAPGVTRGKKKSSLLLARFNGCGSLALTAVKAHKCDSFTLTY